MRDHNADGQPDLFAVKPSYAPTGAAIDFADAATVPRFDGSDYVPAVDHSRLSGQIARVFDAMRCGSWRTLDEIGEITGDPQASISAQLRHLRKPRFGGHTLEKRRRGGESCGLFEYRLQLRERGE